jgi:hypothetical protein
MVGTTAGGTISPMRTKKLTTGVSRDGRRCSTKPTIAPNTTSSTTLPTVRMIELMKAVTSM